MIHNLNSPTATQERKKITQTQTNNANNATADKMKFCISGSNGLNGVKTDGYLNNCENLTNIKSEGGINYDGLKDLKNVGMFVESGKVMVYKLFEGKLKAVDCGVTNLRDPKECARKVMAKANTL